MEIYHISFIEIIMINILQGREDQDGYYVRYKEKGEYYLTSLRKMARIVLKGEKSISNEVENI